MNQIKNRHTGKVIAEGEQSIKELVQNNKAEELSDNLARYSSGVEVEGYATARILELNQTLPDELICQRVKVLVMAGEE